MSPMRLLGQVSQLHDNINVKMHWEKLNPTWPVMKANFALKLDMRKSNLDKLDESHLPIAISNMNFLFLWTPACCDRLPRPTTYVFSLSLIS
jgi:hypothetical protein